MSPEAHIPEARPGGTARPDAATQASFANLVMSRGAVSELIGDTVPFRVAEPQGNPLDEPVVLDSNVTDITQLLPQTSLGDSSHGLHRSRLSGVRGKAAAGIAVATAFAGIGTAAAPAQANRFLATGGTQSPECIDDGAVYGFKVEPQIAVVDPNAQIASVAQPETDEVATADQESEQEEIFIANLPDGNRLIAVIAPPCPTPEPTPKYDVSLSGVDLLNSIIADNQDKKDIEKTSISDIENKIDDMWGKYKDAFSNVRGIDDATVDKQYFKWWLKAMETGHHPNDTKKVIKSYTEQNIIDNRIRYSASSVIETLIVYQNTPDPDARFAIAELLDLERNYAVRGVNPAEWEKANTSFTDTVNNLIIVNKAQLPSSN